MKVDDNTRSSSSSRMSSLRDVIVHLSLAGVVVLSVSWLDIKPIGIIFLAAAAMWLFSVLCPCSLENVKPIQAKMYKNFENFAKLRRDKPAVFCFIVSVALLVLMILGHIVSGTWLVIGGLSVIGFISSRHNIRIVRASEVSRFQANNPDPILSMKTTPERQNNEGTSANTSTPSSRHDDDEFLPEVNESAMQVLNLAGDDAILFSTKSTKAANGSAADDDDEDDDSVPMDMLMPEESLPDVEKDPVLTDDNLSEDEFRLHTDNREKKKPPLIATTSDEEEADVGVESLAKGLNFDDFSDVDASQQALLGHPSHHHHTGQGAASRELSEKVTDFVSNMIPWNKVGHLILSGGGDGDRIPRPESSAVQHKKKDAWQAKDLSFESSDDSEFELLNADEAEAKNAP